ncbi:transporter substrate-binding domain-containing protein [Nocardioides sp. Kera G14]|uniref:transporter substrate-binding domain-containing protein n=1 Tax=Nocardioides sp. Kera G14 TaxID=2884264 RepID=UPI001D104824|nr:transporter substrate-binding domain-containing protein [Nocardioides sp. Kera G14]UDY25159.1 transporter substrate-binding domain-containing protein [Nocardioides sp. Kera G14]
MRRQRWIPLLVVPMVLAMGGCSTSGGKGETTSGAKVAPVSGLTGYAKQLAQSGRLRIGVKYDAPGIGYLAPGKTTPAGFDVEIAKILAGGLGIPADKIEWVQMLNSTREQALTSNAVDLVVASYSMSSGREAQVGMAGPYYVTGAQLLVRAADRAQFSAMLPGPNGNPRVRALPQTLDAKTCTTSGSTAQDVIAHEFRQRPVVKASFADCVGLLQQGGVSAVVADGAVETGYAHEAGGALAVVGDPFTEEKYGVGYQKGMTGMCDYIQRTLLRAYKDGSWSQAFADTLGKSEEASSPEPPAFDPC